MATAQKIAGITETKVVVVEEEKIVLTLSPREAQIVMALLAHCKDTDVKFPEVNDIYMSLRHSGAPDYYDKVDVVDSSGRDAVHYRLANK